MDTLSPAYIESLSKNGYWPYLPGMEKSSVEATCWCAVACRHNAKQAAKTIDYLLSTQNADGGWSDQAGSSSDWATAPALLAISILSHQPKNAIDRSLAAKTAAALKAGYQRLVDLRSDLINDFGKVWMMVLQGPDFDYPRGWPWEPATYNWIEPTAYALLAIKSARLESQKRYREIVTQAQTYLLAKTCKPAGWNFGSPETLGKDWPPMPLPTALALIALQDARHHKVDAAADYLKNCSGPAVDTTVADAFRLIARDARGEDVLLLATKTAERYSKRDHQGENLISIAAATIASRLPHDGNPFKMRS